MGTFLPLAFSRVLSPKRLAGAAVPWCPRCPPGVAGRQAAAGRDSHPVTSRYPDSFFDVR